MKINGMVKNKVLSRLKNITEENDLKNFTFGGGIRDLDEYIDDLMRQRNNTQVKQGNNTQETLSGGVQPKTHSTTDSNESRSLFTTKAIQKAREAAMAASLSNQKIENDFER